MKKFSILILFIIPFLVRSQIFEDDEFGEYTQEWIWGINKNTNGGLIGGFMLRHSRKKKEDVFHTFSLELSNVKHVSEVRYKGIQGTGFIYGKSNYLHTIRTNYGLERILFKKATQKGIQISTSAAMGPTFGLIIPYYVLNINQKYEQFSLVKHPNPQSIAGPGKLFQGLDETDFVLGLHIKGSLFFEFGTYRNNVAGIETGFMLESFTKKIELVPSQPNNFFFSSFFFTLFWGTRK